METAPREVPTDGRLFINVGMFINVDPCCPSINFRTDDLTANGIYFGCRLPSECYTLGHVAEEKHQLQNWTWYILLSGILSETPSEYFNC
jgi:hypothetical protein